MKIYKHCYAQLAAVAGLWLAHSGGVQAQEVLCGTSSSLELNFGSHGVFTGQVLDSVSTPLAVRCHNTAASERRVYICIALGHGNGGTDGTNRIMLNGANQVKYQLYKDASYQTIWGANFGITQDNSQVLLPVMTLAPGAIQTQTSWIYGRMFIEQPTYPPGVYTSIFAQGLMPGWQVTYSEYAPQEYQQADTALEENKTCSPPVALYSIPVNPFKVQVTSEYYCQVITTNVNIYFGNHPDLSTEHKASAPFQLLCGQNVAYQIGISLGVNTHHNLRVMRAGGQISEDITYELYYDPNYTQIWGDFDNSVPNGNVLTDTGTGLSQTHTIYAKTLHESSQHYPSPASGLYQDKAVITVKY